MVLTVIGAITAVAAVGRGAAAGPDTVVVATGDACCGIQSS